ncbi:STAS domain-containing protein [Nocardia farcinica]|uniref:STAS domain-containing protein n=1 Tax=Nocardia farcinica TaxID=37329 RepID=UPI000BF647EB|nr:STAS domain-containing protein [Nocardia farcinica]PFX04948.1 Anti-sigma-F factor antagonist RsfA [Nocardia farcinica]PFX09461.1 Anti-sigma-F factor antagonist RsfA [Nocardia farcinica]
MDSALESRLAQAAHRLPAPEGATTANRRLFSRLRRRGPALVLSPRGAADAYTLDLWRCAVREAVDTAAASACALIVDTSRIDFLSCRALVVLAEEAGRAAERGVPVSLVTPNRTIARIAAVDPATVALLIHSTVVSALTALRLRDSQDTSGRSGTPLALGN